MSDEQSTPTPASAGMEHRLTQQKAEAILRQLAGTAAPFESKLPDAHETAGLQHDPTVVDPTSLHFDGNGRITPSEARRLAKELLHEDKLGDLLEAMPD